jgi:metal-responsive CopG/Arc/MetJ family transcriptional regulator
MKTISLKMDDGLLESVDCSLKKNRYSTRTEFIRDAIRSKLTQLEKDEAIRKLKEFKGSLKGKSKGLGDEEAGRLAFMEIAKKHNIKLD